MSARAGHPRGMVLIAVLVVGLGALLVTTGLLFLTQSEVAASSAAAGTAQSRALAWSGLQAAMAELNAQRRRILEGDLPQLDDQYVIYEHGSRLGVVRLLPITAHGDLMEAEAAKIDINRGDASALVRTGLIDEDTAARVITFRDAAPAGTIASISELLQIDGVSVEDLYGPLDEIRMLDEWEGTRESQRGAGRGIEGARPRGWADFLTVHAVEPALQRSGVRRININRPWSAQLQQAVEARFGSAIALALGQAIQSGTKFETESSVVQALINFQTKPKDWPPILDALTTEAGDYHMGRLDINRASHEALLSLPGLEPEQAARIVQQRDQLSAADRAAACWPVIHDIITPEAFAPLAGRITTRSWMFRVRLASGEVEAENPEGELSAPVIIEAVIDLCDPQPRLAYLRDLSLFETALSLAGIAAHEADRVDGDPAEDAAADAPADEPGDDEMTSASPSEENAGDDAAADAAAPANAVDDELGSAEPAAPGDGTNDGSGSTPVPTPAAGPGRLGRWLPGP